MELHEAIKIAKDLEYAINITVNGKGYFIPAPHAGRKYIITRELLHQLVHVFIIDFDKELVIIRL